MIYSFKCWIVNAIGLATGCYFINRFEDIHGSPSVTARSVLPLSKTIRTRAVLSRHLDFGFYIFNMVGMNADESKFRS